MKRFEELLDAISEASGISTTEIEGMVVFNDFSASPEADKESITAIIRAIEDSLDSHRGKLIEVAGTNVDFNRDENSAILEENIKSLEEFLEHAICAEEVIDFVLTGEENKQTRGKVFGVPADEEEFYL